ncbi:hypothetical protein KXW98_006997 [Aspergillus fumigatus]|nr:hypothetical protein CNMCM8812_004402 [Aspergillus fumigatus]KAH1275992.1 hypothetical protein KXX45_005714 [Aspergillus fumigatus]KAH1293853.1 hypothetical protein KXX30_003518 [Aspergillus fumigatus]KAH1296022.1 hypothetical protein KXX48_001503 [Aspergillus fumigatus]KAH1312691.1 hypothetical protein KXX66_008000 [Aspergillus fumigatus]
MYRIEVLPSTSTHVTPGWTYVPDRGLDPAQAAITPTIGRKRGIRDGGRTDLSSRQNNAIIRHLAELDRENHRDVHIPIPTKPKDAAGRGTRGKTTSNVRRILQSQKTFRNYLDDEEAALAQAAQSSIQRPSLSKVTKPSRRSLTPAATPKLDSSKRKQSTVPPSRASTIPPETSTNANPDTDEDKKQPEPEAENPNRLIKSEYDNDPLLRSYIPSAPSERIMQALLAEPPLTYNAARAGPPLTAKAPRHFCSCYKVHEDSRCGAFF